MTPRTVTHYVPLSMEFYRHKYRTGPQPSTVNYLVQNVSKALLEKFTDYSLYIIELLKFIFNNQGSPGFCASC